MNLIERIEQATEGSRELSDECLLARGFKRRQRLSIDGKPMPYWLWDFPDGTRCYPNEVPDPSRNVQDCIDWMVPEGWGAELKKTPDGRGLARLFDSTPYPNVKKTNVIEAATPALALCAASRAIEAMKESDDG